MVRRTSLLASGLLAAVFAIGACGSNDYRYVNNSSEGTFFKIPSDWRIYRIKAEEVTDRPSPAERQGPWHVVFDSSAKPDAAHADEARPQEPVGQALIFE